MKKLSLAVLATFALAACTADVYSDKGNATVLSSKEVSPEVVELTIQRDNGEVVTLTREYDAHAAVGARIHLADEIQKQDSDVKTIRRYEFK
ncbi:deoxyribose-phosphate aldolase [Mannheimia bovis]|uniref:Deoxyribose-phosphate aldolase n=1 Tax=Mannheimia indoligenes TaxID=3103145 RepID=A0ABU7ZGV4_9PAST|nr:MULTISPECIES: deoxyribose-phosphate aldolase [Mannheimia]AHG74057.1 Deoxyribose-phosphate aldolase [Mannheimia sp. USDA-ARS-USMARC-1261]WHP47940.1 deoxyribose-phosphate aldolase [Mannheimia bovis]